MNDSADSASKQHLGQPHQQPHVQLHVQPHGQASGNPTIAVLPATVTPSTLATTQTSSKPDQTLHQNRLVAGAVCVLGAGAAFAAMSVCIKLAANQINLPTIVFLRNGLALLILLPLIWQYSARHADRYRNIRLYSMLPQHHLLRFMASNRMSLHIARAVIGLTAMYGFFYTIPKLSLPEAMLLTYSAPLFLPFIGAIWLKEKLLISTIIAAIIGFIGIAVILQPSADLLHNFYHNAAVIGVLAGLLAAIAMACIRKMSDTEPTLRVVLWFVLFSTAASAVPMLWSWQTPTILSWACMAGCAIFATLGQLLITRGYHLAPASRVGVFSYATVLFATAYAALLGSSLPPTIFWVGFALVVIAGGLIMLSKAARS